MAAPSNTVWGSISNDYVRLGIAVTTTNSNTQTKVAVEVWIWSKWSLRDSANTLYFNDLSAAGSATTSCGSKTVKTTVESGTEWSTSNQQKLYSYSKIYNRSKSNATRYLYAKLANIYNHSTEVTLTASTTATIPKLASYAVAYNANGGSGAPENQTKWYGEALTLSSTKPTRTGYTFKGWATSANGSVVNQPGGTYTGNAAVTYYAVWQANTYTVAYNANGGTGAPGNQTKTYGTTLKLSTVKPTRTNYTFKGWATSATATTATYQPGGNYTANSAATLYAVWELAYTKPRIKNLVVERWDEAAGEASDEGTSLHIKFDWETDKNAASVVAWYMKAEDADWGSSFGPSVTGKNGSFDVVRGSGNISTDSTYMVRVRVADGTTDSEATTIVKTVEPSSSIAYKVHPPKSAGGEEMFETLFPLKMSGGFYCNKLLTSGGSGVNIDDYKTPGFFMSVNNSSGTYIGLPDWLPDSITVTLEVLSAGAEGQILQRLTTCSKENPIEAIRHYYQGTWGAWRRTGGYVLYENTDTTNTNAVRNAPITLKETAANFKFIEIFFIDNQNKSGGYTKVYSPNGKTVCLSVTEAGNATNTYIRRTLYTISGTTLTPNTESANYVRFNGDSGEGLTGSVKHSSNILNYLKIVCVVGYE